MPSCNALLRAIREMSELWYLEVGAGSWSANASSLQVLVGVPLWVLSRRSVPRRRSSGECGGRRMEPKCSIQYVYHTPYPDGVPMRVASFAHPEDLRLVDGKRPWGHWPRPNRYFWTSDLTMMNAGGLSHRIGCGYKAGLYVSNYSALSAWSKFEGINHVRK